MNDDLEKPIESEEIIWDLCPLCGGRVGVAEKCNCEKSTGIYKFCVDDFIGWTKMERELAVMCKDFDMLFHEYNELIKEEIGIHKLLEEKAEKLKSLKGHIDNLRAKICN